MLTLLVSPAEWATLTALRLVGGEATPEQIAERAGKPERTVRNALNELRIKKAVTARRVLVVTDKQRRGVRVIYYSLARGVRAMVSFERSNAAIRLPAKKMQGRALRLGIPVNEDEFKAVKAAALESGTSVAEYVRLRLQSGGEGG